MNLNLDYEKIVKEILDEREFDVYKLDEHDLYDINNIVNKGNWDVRIIALMGEMGSGKSTVAEMIWKKLMHSKYNGYNGGYAEIVSFADMMKFYAHKYMGIERNEENKPRKLYQTFGEECRKVDPLIWVKCLASQIIVMISTGVTQFVIDDLRFPQERLWAFENDIPVIKVEAHPIIRKERMEKRGDVFTSEMMNHDTEKWVNILDYHLKIENNGSDLDVLRKKVDHLIDRELPNLFIDFDESWGD